jgi:hypothetical protein
MILNPQTVEVKPLQARSTDRLQSHEIPKENRGPESANETAVPLQEVVIVGLAEQLVATRIATPLRDIPQTVSIVTGEQMRQRKEITLADVLEHAPGISMGRESSAAEAFGHSLGCPSREPCSDVKLDRMLDVLSPEIRNQVETVLIANRRIPEEVLGPNELRGAWLYTGENGKHGATAAD